MPFDSVNTLKLFSVNPPKEDSLLILNPVFILPFISVGLQCEDRSRLSAIAHLPVPHFPIVRVITDL